MKLFFRQMRYPENIRRVLFSKESLTEKMIPYVGLVGIPAFLIFYLTCKSMGYWESFTLRLICSIACIPLIFYPRRKSISMWCRLYWELFLLLVLPVFFTYMYLKNGMSTYWFISAIWAGLFYGLFSSKVFLPVFLFPLAYLTGSVFYLFETNGRFEFSVISIGGLSVGWLTTILAAVAKLGMNIFYFLALDAEAMRIKADEAEKRRIVLETKNTELIARNAIISTFVRPSILNEINLGKDPRLFKPRITSKAILICDMRNFTPRTSKMVDAEVQAQFINKYFEMMIAPVFKAGGEVDKLMGDAIMAVFPDGRSALTAALDMRKRLQVYNKQLVFAGHRKIENVISISKGNTLEANIGAEQKLDRTYIGAAVNVCSRLENVAKLYGLEVIVTKEIIEDMPECREYRLVDIIKVKGYDTKFEVFEAYGHQAESVIAFKNSIKERLHEGIRLYFQKGKMKDAAEIFKGILYLMPSHNYEPSRLMDPIVHYYALRCINSFNHYDLFGRALNVDEGCHDFGADVLPRDWSQMSNEELIEKLNDFHNERDSGNNIDFNENHANDMVSEKNIDSKDSIHRV